MTEIAHSQWSSELRVVVNGAPYSLDMDHRTTLLELLRDRLDLTGTKKGCDHGQCGYCPPGQICSAVAMLDEADTGWPSAVTEDDAAGSIRLDETEIRERMSGNLCRCGAYVNIVAAIQAAARAPR